MINSNGAHWEPFLIRRKKEKNSKNNKNIFVIIIDDKIM